MNKMNGYTRFESVGQPPQLDTSIQFVPAEYLADAIRCNKRACVYTVDRLTDDMVKELRTLDVHVNTRDKSVTLPNT